MGDINPFFLFLVWCLGEEDSHWTLR